MRAAGVALMIAIAMGAEGVAQSPVVPRYVNENPKDPAPLKLRELQGTVHGLGGDPMARAMVSLFTEDTHTLVGSETTDRNGKFKFDKVQRGAYRIVARVEGLCPANIPVIVEGGLLGHRKLEITMRPKDIDTCSYGMAK
jgi:protocatechuate 3,4-dioxygenase beta subunit